MNCKPIYYDFPPFEEIDFELGKSISHSDIEHITENEDEYSKDKSDIIRILKYDWII